MGFQSAAHAAAGGTQQAMMYQFGAAAQQAEALRQAQAQAAAELKSGREQGIGALQAAQGQAVPALQAGQQQGIGALQAGQEQGIGALQAGQAGALAALPQFYREGVGYQQPYMDVGGGAVNRLGVLYGQGGEYTQQPTLEQLQMDPGYNFRLQQGQQAMLNAARGGGLAGSGAALKAAARYGAGEASQEYQNAYSRFMANRLAATQGLQNLATGGLSAAGTATGLAGQTGANIANVYGQTAANQANLYGQTAANQANLYGQTGANLSNVYTGTGANIANTATGTAANLANTYANTGNQLANVYGGLGQGLAQGAANIGSIYAQGAMGPTNLLAALAGQGIQAGGSMLGAKYAKTGSFFG